MSAQRRDEDIMQAPGGTAVQASTIARRRDRRPPLALALALLLPTLAAAQAPQLRRDAGGLHAELALGECRASLSRANDRPALRYRNDCQAALADNLGTLSRLLDALGAEALAPAVELGFDSGRLLTTWPESARRLAQAAQADRRWDAARAWRDPAVANRGVIALAGAAPVFAELRALFRARGRDLQLRSVEKVLMAVPAQLPFAFDAGADPARRLPFDAQLWFRLVPAPATPAPPHPTRSDEEPAAPHG